MSDKEGKEDEVDAVVIVTGTSQDVGGVGFVLHVWGGGFHHAESDKEEDAGQNLNSTTSSGGRRLSRRTPSGTRETAARAESIRAF